MPNGSTSDWSPELDAKIIELRDEKFTCILIGQFVGKSGSAIAGRIRRLGLASVRKFLTPEERVQRKRQWNAKYKARTAPSAQRRQTFIAAPIDTDQLHVSLADLAPNGCRFPYGDGPFTFCNHPRLDDSSYCGPHHALCWVAPRRTWRNAA